MADTDANGVVSLEELVAVVKFIEPQAAVRGSPEYRYTMAIHKALGEGRVSYCAVWSVPMRTVVVLTSARTHGYRRHK